MSALIHSHPNFPNRDNENFSGFVEVSKLAPKILIGDLKWVNDNRNEYPMYLACHAIRKN